MSAPQVLYGTGGLYGTRYNSTQTVFQCIKKKKKKRKCHVTCCDTTKLRSRVQDLVCTRVPGTCMVMFSHAKSQPIMRINQSISHNKLQDVKAYVDVVVMFLVSSHHRIKSGV